MKRTCLGMTLVATMAGCLSLTPPANEQKRDDGRAQANILGTSAAQPDGRVPIARAQGAPLPPPASGTVPPVAPAMALYSLVPTQAAPRPQPLPGPTSNPIVPAAATLPIPASVSENEESTRELVLRGSQNPEVIKPVSLPPQLPLTPLPLPQKGGLNGTPAGAAAHHEPILRVVNTKQIHFLFDVRDAGASGIAGVEVWGTTDGRTWKKCEIREQGRTCVVEVEQEGMYGFTLLARNGVGISHEPPHEGDLPQVWVVVDETAPEVKVLEPIPHRDARPRTVEVNWKASDANLRRNSISILSAPGERGPWKVVAANLDNSGHYVWQLSDDVPASVLLRVEATDLAGNVGQAQTEHPVILDTRVPEIVIEGVEPGGASSPRLIPGS